MVALTFQVTPEGRLPEGIKDTLKRLIPEWAGKKLTMTLVPYKKRASNSQREYYFAVIVPAWQTILHETQDEYYDKDEAHDYLMEEIGGWFKPLKKGEKHPKRRSYMDFTTEECERHHALCRAKAAEEGYQIEEPNEMSMNT